MEHLPSHNSSLFQKARFHDPDLAEGIPTTAGYFIEGDTGRLIGDARVLPNGGFESTANNQFTGFSWYDNPNSSIFIDSDYAHTGRYSARCTNLKGKNT